MKRLWHDMVEASRTPLPWHLEEIVGSVWLAFVCWRATR